MPNQFLTNYTETTFLEKIKDNLRHCKSFDFSVSFIKKVGLILLFKDIEAAIDRGCKGRIITSTYQNFTDIESLRSFYSLMGRCPNFKCHLDYECFHDTGYATLGYHSKGYLFQFDDCCDLIVGSSNITRYALLKNIEWDVVVHEDSCYEVYQKAMSEFEDKWESMANLPISDLSKLKSSSYAYLFIRKVSDENGIVLPFTYLGKGNFQNCRKTDNGNGTYLFDIKMENELPDYLQYDFGLTK